MQSDYTTDAAPALSFSNVPYTCALIGASTWDGNTLVYAILSPDEAARIWASLPHPRPIIAAISGIDWNADLSPWPAKAVFRGEDFSGGASAFLHALETALAPACEERLPAAPKRRVIAGYSLAGLFAVWACARSRLFDAVASMSGSLWFDGFPEWLEAHIADFAATRVYLSLGDLERKTRNPRMARVAEDTRRVMDLLARADVNVVFESNPGNHFADVEARIAKGIAAVCQG